MATAEQNSTEARRIINCIRQVRAEHHACTAREVARLTKTQHSLMQKRLANLRAAEMVTWTAMPGSLRVTAKGGKFAPRES